MRHEKFKYNFKYIFIMKTKVNTFMFEGVSGKNVYNRLKIAFRKCKEYDKEYEFDTVNGITYTIIRRQSDFIESDNRYYSNYELYAKQDGNVIADTWFCEDSDYRFLYSSKSQSNNVLFLREVYDSKYGPLQLYIRDTELFKESGFYFRISILADGELIGIDGYTNDMFNKYFQPTLEIIEGYDLLSKEQRSNMSYDDQVLWCECNTERVKFLATKRVEDFKSICEIL